VTSSHFFITELPTAECFAFSLNTLLVDVITLTDDIAIRQKVTIDLELSQAYEITAIHLSRVFCYKKGYLSVILTEKQNKTKLCQFDIALPLLGLGRCQGYA